MRDDVWRVRLLLDAIPPLVHTRRTFAEARFVACRSTSTRR